MGPVVRLHHPDEIPTAVLENTERDKERSRVEGKVKVKDWRVIFESRFIAPEVSGSVRQKFTAGVRGARKVGLRLQESQELHQLVSARILSENLYRRTVFMIRDRKCVGKQSRLWKS